MRTAKTVNEMVQRWKNEGRAKHDVVVLTANECIGWPYVFGGRGEYCTPSNRKSRYRADCPTIYSKCQVLRSSNPKPSCDGCDWHPGGTVLFFDCRGFTYWLFKLVNIEIKGGGATSQYNDDSNWERKGPISEMPRDKVCCAFRYDNNTKKMEHTLLYDGNGHFIHCSNNVQKCDIAKYKATHYAIPKGLYGGVTPVPVDPKTQATVYAENGYPVKMRDKPSTSCNSYALVKCGETVNIIEKGNDWSHISYNNREGYMMTKFLKFNTSTTPVETPKTYTCTIKGLTKTQADELSAKYSGAIIMEQ